MISEVRVSAGPAPAPIWVGGVAVRYGVPIGQQDHQGQTYLESFAKGCFYKTVASGGDVAAELDGQRVAVRSSGTLRLEPDEEGLWYEIAVPAGDEGAALLAKLAGVKRVGVAFSLRGPGSDQWEGTGEQRTRTLRDVVLEKIVLSSE